MRVLRLVFGAIVFAVLVIACSTTDTAEAIRKAELASGCILNSDCNTPLVCAFKTCHDKCQDSRDCPDGQRCLQSDRPFHVCQLPAETGCSSNAQCPTGQVCGIDNQCRDQCKVERDCLALQKCVSGTCADDKELVDGGLPIAVTDAGSTMIPNVGTPCTYSSDCPDALLCRNGSCAFECIKTRDCLAGSTCVENHCVAATPEVPDATVRSGDAGIGAGCIYDSTCGNGLLCRNAMCVFECSSTSECPSGRECLDHKCSATQSPVDAGVPPTHIPDGAPDGYAGGCVLHSDCVKGLLCRSGVCVYECVESVDCDPGICCSPSAHTCTATCAVDASVVDSSEAGPIADAGPDSSADAGTDAGVDAAPEAGAPDAGVDTGAPDTGGGGYTLSVTVGGGGQGIVSSAPVGIQCGAVCTASFAASTGVVLSASPSNGSAFLGWTGSGCSGTGTCSVLMNAARSVTANFAPGPTGSITWIKSFPTSTDGGTPVVSAEGVARDANDNVMILLRSNKPYDLGGGLLTPNTQEFLLGKYTPAGAPLWSRKLGQGSSVLNSGSVAVDLNGDVFVAGSIVQGSNVSFGAGTLCNGYQGFVAKYNGATGGYLWHTCIDYFVPTAITTDAAGSVLLGGTGTGYSYHQTGFANFYATTNCSFNNDYITQRGNAGMLMKLSTAGARTWARMWGCVNNVEVTGIVVDSSSNILVSGYHDQFVNLGCANTLPTLGGLDMNVSKFNTNGGCLWSRALGDAQTDTANAISVDPQGNAVVVGGYQGQLDPANGQAPLISQGSSDIALMKLNAADGTVAYAKSFGSSGNDYGTSVSVAPNGDIRMTAAFSGNVDFGGVPLASQGAIDTLLARTTSTGLVQVATGYGGSGADGFGFILTAGATKLAIYGDTAGGMNFGAGALPAGSFFGVIVPQ